MSEGIKMPLKMAQAIAERFMAYLKPYVNLMSIAGSVRRECAEVGDIEVVIVPKDEFSMGIAFPEGYQGMVVNGSRLKRFKYEQNRNTPLQIELYITNIADYGRILAIRTGSSAYSHHLAMQWNRRGWAGTEDGLRRKSECIHKSIWKISPEYKLAPTLPPVFNTEEKFFEFIGVAYIDPKQRSWVSNNAEYNYKL
jgi:DNA polymerase/3'-5' exonuclease PolX